MPGRENNIASEGKGLGFVGARSKVVGEKGLGSFAFVYTQNTLRLYEKHLVSVRETPCVCEKHLV
jgi:hypothetical protein